MNNLPDHLVRQYEDGPDWPTTDERQNAERAYRDAFLLSAREAAHWTSIDKDAINRAWEERRRARRLAEVLIPSATYFGDPRLPGQQVVYRRVHLVDASRTRGRVHGFEFVRQCWEALLEGGVEEQAIAPQIIRPWLESVAEWVATEIAPDRLDTPRLPDEDLSERQRRMLEHAKHVIATSDPTKPHAILLRLYDITREQLEWLWPGRIPLGKLTLLAGDPGLGKSFVTLDLAARVSRGERNRSRARGCGDSILHAMTKLPKGPRLFLMGMLEQVAMLVRPKMTIQTNKYEEDLNFAVEGCVLSGEGLGPRWPAANQDGHQKGTWHRWSCWCGRDGFEPAFQLVESLQNRVHRLLNRFKLRQNQFADRSACVDSVGQSPSQFSSFLVIECMPIGRRVKALAKNTVGTDVNSILFDSLGGWFAFWPERENRSVVKAECHAIDDPSLGFSFSGH